VVANHLASAAVAARLQVEAAASMDPNALAWRLFPRTDKSHLHPDRSGAKSARAWQPFGEIDRRSPCTCWHRWAEAVLKGARRYHQVNSASIRHFRSFSRPSQVAGALSSVDRSGFPSLDDELIRPV